MVSGWFKCITFVVHFISNLMLPLIWQEVPVQGLEVGDLWLIKSKSSVQLTRLLPPWTPAPSSLLLHRHHSFQPHAHGLSPPTCPTIFLPLGIPSFRLLKHSSTLNGKCNITSFREHFSYPRWRVGGVGVQLLIPHCLWREKSYLHHPPRTPWPLNESCLVVSDSLWPHGLYSPWNSPVQNTGVSGWSLLQGIFPTQGSNQGLLLCRRILYQLSYLP